MARPRKWESESERLAAYRKRKQEELVEPELPARDVNVEPAGPSKQKAYVTLEAYIEEALAGARLHHQKTSPQATMSTKTLAARLAQAEAYARWRYQGFLDGEVASL